MEGLTDNAEKTEKAKITEKRRGGKEKPRTGGKLWKKKNNISDYNIKETEDVLETKATGTEAKRKDKKKATIKSNKNGK